jgi:hypothetical protein
LGIIRLADLYYLAVMGLVVLTRACPGPRARVALAAMSRLEHWIRRYPEQFRNWHLVGARAGRPVPAARGAVALGPTGAGGEAVRAGRRG